MIDLNALIASAASQDRKKLEQVDLDELSQALAEKAEWWIPALFPRGERDGQDLRLANIKGEAPRKNGSCVIHLRGVAAGAWYDHSIHKGGGPLSTLSEGSGLSGAALIEEARRLCGLNGTASPPKKAANGTNGHGRLTEADRKLVEARRLWEASQEARGSLVGTYLAARGPSSSLSYHEMLGAGDAAEIRFLPAAVNEKLSKAEGHPTLIARFRDACSGEPTGGVHRIFLLLDGSWHIGGVNAKLSLGPSSGAVVMLGTGPDAQGQLAIGEGIESTLAGAQIFGIPAAHCWATTSTGQMRSVARAWEASAPAIPIKKLCILSDAGQDGQAAAQALALAAQKHGIETWIETPRGGDDFADDLARGLWEQGSEIQISRNAVGSEEDFATAVADCTPSPNLSALIQSLISTSPPSQLANVLREIAAANLPELEEYALLRQISKANGFPTTTLTRGLRALKKTERRESNGGGATGSRIDQAIQAICRRYVFVKQIDAFFDRETRQICGLDGVRHSHWSEMPPNDEGQPTDPRDVLIKGVFGPTADKADLVTFVPGEPEIYADPEQGGVPCLNIWTNPEINFVEGDATPFLEHIAFILDYDAQAEKWFLDYLAHLVQKPAIKIKSAILIIGETGIGKSMIGEVMSDLLGRNNTTPLEPTDLNSNFNEWMDGVQLIVVHELMTFDRRETMNRLKTYITDPWIRINRKNTPTYRYRNRVNFMMFSNHRDAASLEKGDRRYFVWISKAIKKEREYYISLVDWLENQNGNEIFLNYLMNRDIRLFDPNAAPPDTQSKSEIIHESRSAAEAYLQDAFEAKDMPFQHDLVVLNDLIDYLADRKKMKISSRFLGKLLNDWGAADLGPKRIEHDAAGGYRPRRVRVWALRHDEEDWLAAPESEIAAAFKGPYVA